MLTLDLTGQSNDLTFAIEGRTVVRMRRREDDSWALTNIPAGRTTLVPSCEVGVARAQRIVRMLTAGNRAR